MVVVVGFYILYSKRNFRKEAVRTGAEPTHTYDVLYMIIFFFLSFFSNRVNYPHLSFVSMVVSAIAVPNKIEKIFTANHTKGFEMVDLPD